MKAVSHRTPATARTCKIQILGSLNYCGASSIAKNAAIKQTGNIN